MDINKFSGLISTICVFALFHTVLGSELVPVFMWGSPKSTELVPALTQVNKDTFKEILFAKIEKSNTKVIVFAEKSLSPEDFGDQRKETFKEILLLSANNELTYLPLVEDPVDTVKDLHPKDIFAEISITDTKSAKNIPNDTVVIVSLDDARDDEDRTDMLMRHDKTVSKLYKELLKDHSQILVLFTGFQSSWLIPEQIKIKNHRQSRSVTDKPEAAAEAKDDKDIRVFLNFTSLAFYLNSSVQIINVNDETKVETIEYYQILPSSIQDITDNITNGTEPRADDDEPKKEPFIITANGSRSFELTFSEESGYWKLETIATDGDTFTAKNVYAPVGFSYHCDNAIIEKNNKAAKTKTILKFSGLQIQYKGSTRNGFGDAYDCVGFTTAPIWSGLFITFILALIMTLGLTMMMDIKTMDRFDDPKGKTIIINAAE